MLWAQPTSVTESAVVPSLLVHDRHLAEELRRSSIAAVVDVTSWPDTSSTGLRSRREILQQFPELVRHRRVTVPQRGRDPRLEGCTGFVLSPEIEQGCAQAPPPIALVVGLVEVEPKLTNPIFRSAGVQILERQPEPEPRVVRAVSEHPLERPEPSFRRHAISQETERSGQTHPSPVTLSPLR